MKIRKAFQGTVPENKILDTYSTSQTDTYSCNFVNNNSLGMDWFKFREKSVSVTVPSGGSNFNLTSSLEEPTGYKYFTVVPKHNGYADQWVVSYSEYGNKIIATIYSKYGGTLTNPLDFYIIYIREDLYDIFKVS